MFLFRYNLSCSHLPHYIQCKKILQYKVSTYLLEIVVESKVCKFGETYPNKHLSVYKTYDFILLFKYYCSYIQVHISNLCQSRLHQCTQYAPIVWMIPNIYFILPNIMLSYYQDTIELVSYSDIILLLLIYIYILLI